MSYDVNKKLVQACADVTEAGLNVVYKVETTKQHYLNALEHTIDVMNKELLHVDIQESIDRIQTWLRAGDMEPTVKEDIERVLAFAHPK